MIRLTEAWEKGFYYANPEKIIMIQEHDLESGKVTYVKTDNGGVMYVKESPEEVVRKVLEWRLAMEDYLQGTAMVRKQAKEKLFELAGLEEQKDAPETSD